jgi:phosphoglycolate phosphatase
VGEKTVNSHLIAPNCQAILLDLDGTLIDTVGDFVTAINHMLTDLFAQPNLMDESFQTPQIKAHEITQMVGKGSEHLMSQALQWAETCQPERQITDLNSWQDWALGCYLSHYAKINGHFSKLYPGVEATLKSWQQMGLPLVCLTNKPERFARALLTQKNCLGYFNTVIGGDTFERKKPHPLPLLKACEGLKTLPQNTLMVGDSINDVQAARAAQCPVILVSYGYNHGQPAHTAGADRVVDSLEELITS